MDRMESKTALVTGATSGIGLETARGLAALGARVLVHGRSATKAEEAARSVSECGLSEPVSGDFASLSEVRALARMVREKAPALDVVVNNAGVFANSWTLTPDDHELTFQVNHLSTMLLSLLLVPSLCEAGRGRVITVSSVAHFKGDIDVDDLDHRRGFEGYQAYADSKLANVLFAFELAERLRCHGVTSNALHPGVVTTKLLAFGFPNAHGGSVADGAATSVYLAAAGEVRDTTGAYFVDRHEAHASPKSRDATLRALLWERSARMLELTAEEALA
jgi:NAD(P)-dependent dehydrogenase (short-subunit alcohol dehydrogenase family)